MDSFLSNIFPKGLFGGLNHHHQQQQQQQQNAEAAAEAAAARTATTTTTTTVPAAGKGTMAKSKADGTAAAAAAAASAAVAADGALASSLMHVDDDLPSPPSSSTAGNGALARKATTTTKKKRSRGDVDDDEGEGKVAATATTKSRKKKRSSYYRAVRRPSETTPILGDEEGLVARPTKRRRGLFRDAIADAAGGDGTASGADRHAEGLPPFGFAAGHNGDGDASSAFEKKKVEKPVSPLKKLPEDVLAHCMSFLGGVEDRYALQCTSKQFRKLSNEPEMLERVQVGGDRSTGLHGVIQETDCPDSAQDALAPFAEAGNLEAIYM